MIRTTMWLKDHAGMNAKLRRLIGSMAAVGFLASVAVHISALAGMDVAAAFPAVWALHAGIFAVFVPFILAARKEYGGRVTLTNASKDLPPSVVAFGAALFAYAVVNFGISIIQTGGGNAVQQGAQYVLKVHGAVVRTLTLAEYSALKATEVRLFSGHWMVFYFIPAAYFLFHRPNVPAAGPNW
jgi:hypothetical protein